MLLTLTVRFGRSPVLTVPFFGCSPIVGAAHVAIVTVAAVLSVVPHSLIARTQNVVVDVSGSVK